MKRDAVPDPPLRQRQPRLRSCYDGRFEELPDHVRHQGPWQAMHRGEIDKLKANYRRALARDGYALVTSDLAVFKPEA